VIIMTAKVKKTALVILIAGLIVAWGCSSGPKPSARPNSTPAATTAKTQGQSAPVKTPAAPAKTEIPAKEKQLESVETGATDKTGLQEKEELSVMMEEAMNACQDCDQHWAKGQLDDALSALDEAYALLLKMELPPDSPLSQEKANLRLMIAKRIQTVHASRIASPRENHKTIPLDENKYVLKEIESFRTVERKSFEEAYERSGLYREMMAAELRQAGVPEELSWLPMIESWFKVRALSRARALGLWQFISSTGSLYDLKRDRYIDERMDPVKETRAAARYLFDLHALFGDWTTALAAYNCGEFGVQRVISTQQINYLDNFWDLFAKLPYETARFVPRFIAAQLIINNPEKYGFSLPTPYPPLKYETVGVNHAAKLSALSQTLGLDSSEMAFLNPELRYDATPDYDYQLKVPVGQTDKAGQAIASLPKWVPPEATYTIHYVRSGETLGLIAARYHSSVAAIVKLNGLRSSKFIRPGWQLKVPGRGAASVAGAPVVKVTDEKTASLGPSLRNAAAPQAAATPSNGDTYTVVEGDTPYSIAKKHGLPLDEFLAANNMTVNSVILPGQVVSVKNK
jgi:membrane-bound lytic murein transglycosylase D